MYTHSNYWGGCRCGPFPNYWERYSQIIGGYIPHLPLFWHPPALQSYSFPKTVFERVLGVHCDIEKDVFTFNVNLRESLAELNQESPNQFCCLQAIKWAFIHPTATHVGGAW